MKKILGYVFIILGCFLSMCLMLLLLEQIPFFIGLIAEGGAFNVGNVLGSLLYDAFVLGLIVLLLRTGIKWVKQRKVKTTDDVVDSY